MLMTRRTITIEWGDCDPAGIVFYPRYFAFFDACTWALFARGLGMAKAAVLRAYDIVGCPMVDTRARFIHPSSYGDEVTVESQVREFRKSSFDVQHRLLRDGELAVEGFETRVWTGRDLACPARLKARPIPSEVIAALSRTTATEPHQASQCRAAPSRPVSERVTR
jgi:4-hydroxybenzoyl-CoA thioesterase